MNQLLNDLREVESLLCDGGWATGRMKRGGLGLIKDRFCLEGAVQEVTGWRQEQGLPSHKAPQRYKDLYHALRDQMRLRPDSWFHRLTGSSTDHQWNSLWAWNDEQTSVEPVLEAIKSAIAAEETPL